MWRARVEYGKSHWLEAEPGKVTLSTKMPTLRIPYAILHILARTIHRVVTEESEPEKRVNRLAGTLGGRGFEKRLLEAARSRYKASIEDRFLVDMGWLKLEFRENRLDVDIDKEAALAALSTIGSLAWPMGSPWPTLIPKTREGDLRGFIHTYCDTPWMRDLVDARTFLGLGSVDKSLITRLEEKIGCSVELASWGITARKPKTMELCPMNPVVFSVLPFLHYARYPPYNLLLLVEDPALHLNTEMMEALADLFAAMLEKNVSIVLWGEGAERLHRMLRERGAQYILA